MAQEKFSKGGRRGVWSQARPGRERGRRRPELARCAGRGPGFIFTEGREKQPKPERPGATSGILSRSSSAGHRGVACGRQARPTARLVPAPGQAERGSWFRGAVSAVPERPESGRGQLIALSFSQQRRRLHWEQGSLRAVWPGGWEGARVEGGFSPCLAGPGVPFPLLARSSGLFAVGSPASWPMFRSPIQAAETLGVGVLALSGPWRVSTILPSAFCVPSPELEPREEPQRCTQPLDQQLQQGLTRRAMPCTGGAWPWNRGFPRLECSPPSPPHLYFLVHFVAETMGTLQ